MWPILLSRINPGKVACHDNQKQSRLLQKERRFLCWTFLSCYCYHHGMLNIVINTLYGRLLFSSWKVKSIFFLLETDQEVLSPVRHEYQLILSPVRGPALTVVLKIDMLDMLWSSSECPGCMVWKFLLPRQILDYFECFFVSMQDDFSCPLFYFCSVPFTLMTIELVDAVFCLCKSPAAMAAIY